MFSFKKKVWRKIFAASLGISLTLSAFPTILNNDQPIASAASSASGNQVHNTGKRFLGVPYKLGGNTPRAFDCQGFTSHVYQKNGVKLPAGARNQSLVGKRVSKGNLKVGDLVFFSTSATVKYSASSLNRIGHVGIYAGNGKVLHTFNKDGVKYSDMRSKWWSSHYVTARRVLNSSASTTKPSKSQLSLSTLAKSNVAHLQPLLKQYGYKTYSQPNDWLKKGTTINPNSIQRGDIAFFTMGGNRSSIDRAAIYLGNGELLYKTNSGSKKYNAYSKDVQNRLVVIKRAT